MFDMVFKSIIYKERDSFMILGSYFYQSIEHGQQISTIVAVILEKGTSYYYMYFLNIVV